MGKGWARFAQRLVVGTGVGLLLCAGLLAVQGVRAGTSAPVALRLAAYPPHLVMEVGFEDASGDRMLDAGEKGTLKVTVRNTGKGDALGVRVRVRIEEGSEGLSLPAEVDVGSVAAGTSRVVSVPVTASGSVATALRKIRLECGDSFGFRSDPVVVSFSTRKRFPPDLRVVDLGVDDASQNARIEPGETVRVTVRIRNVGKGTARGVHAEVRTGDKVYLLPDSPDRFSLGDLKPGAYKDVVFSLVTSPDIGRGRIPVTLALSDSEGRFRKRESLDRLVLYERQSRPREIVVRPVPEKKPGPVPALSVDVERDIPECAEPNPFGVAVIIGNRDYRSGDVPRVRFALRDAAVMQEYVRRTLGYAPGNILLFKNATQGDFRSLFGTKEDYRGRLYNIVQAHAGRCDVFVYYSGHGAPDPATRNGYFVPSDCDPSLVRLNGYSLDTFYRNLSHLPARSVTVVLDACFSGASEGGTLLPNTSPISIRVRNPLVAWDRGVVFASSSGRQVSTWYPAKNHGLFTYFFLKGLRGAADADRDGRIYARELEAYLKKTVPVQARVLANRDQEPQLLGNGDILLVRLK